MFYIFRCYVQFIRGVPNDVFFTIAISYILRCYVQFILLARNGVLFSISISYILSVATFVMLPDSSHKGSNR